MGKDLKGRELGVGISQRKDGMYTARFTDSFGKRRQQYFKKLQECRNWIAQAQFDDEHGNALRSDNPTVDAWYEYWIDNVKGANIRYNTRRNYNERYERNVKPFIGDMLLKDVKPLHCQHILNKMGEAYANSIVKQCRAVMSMMFGCAVENEIIPKNPVTNSVKCASGRKKKEPRVLTVDEQKIFLETIRGTRMYNQYALVLQTGLRTGEMVGLRWSDVDFDKKMIRICRTMEYRKCTGEWRTGDNKTKSGTRTIPLTQEACSILRSQKEKSKSLKVVPMEFSDIVFLSEKGVPVKNNAYDSLLYYYCDRIGLRRFSMHALRHTFATRCIESGMRPKTLQMILGHANISMTMDLYVHVTEDSKKQEIEKIERSLKIV